LAIIEYVMAAESDVSDSLDVASARVTLLRRFGICQFEQQDRLAARALLP
jgi:hypothetical protein